MAKHDNALLKSAIADADSIKKIALENARAAIMETFEPELKNLLNSQLAEDADEEEDMEESTDLNETELDEKKKAPATDDCDDEPAPDEEDMDESIDIDAILAEIEKEEKGDDTEDMDEAKKKVADNQEDGSEETDDDSDLDEDATINQLLSELSEGDDEEEAPEEEDDEEVDEAADGGLVAKIKAGLSKIVPDKDTLKKIDDFLRQVAQGMQQSDSGKTGLPMEEMQAELQESKVLVTKLVKKVNEGNLLTAQLLYMNKILKECNLDKSEKIKVIKAFDKATTVKEAKVIHEALSGAYKAKTTKKTNIKESIGFSSKSAGGSTKSTKVPTGGILNESQVARWAELAGLN